MNYEGLIVGFGALIIIGLLHPVVINVEYSRGKKAWPFFLINGLGAIFLSMITLSFVSDLLAILGFSLLWSIREIFEQEERVLKGWFPENPKRKAEYDAIRAKRKLAKPKK